MATAALRLLMEAAGAEDNAALAATIERSGRRRAPKRELAGAARAFRAMGGGDAAARAEAARQEAIAALRAIAERYVHARTSALPLRWAIDRHCRERQGPMLRRAGALFRALTGGSFERLAVRYDDKDLPRLAGLRPDDEEVPVAGMSGGTEDQLYLALGIAALEAHVEAGGAALPFVADDLLVAFDPDRSAASFEILGRLAERAHVLFFTHHPHLVDLARDALGADTHVAELG